MKVLMTIVFLCLCFSCAKDTNKDVEPLNFSKSNLKTKCDTLFYIKNALEEGRICDGLKMEYWFHYHPNGEIEAEGRYQNDLKEGTWVYYDENSSVIKTGEYYKGKKDGYWKYYYANGQPQKQGHYKLDVQEEWWQFYKKNGELERLEEFANGEVLKVKMIPIQ